MLACFRIVKAEVHVGMLKCLRWSFCERFIDIGDLKVNTQTGSTANFFSAPKFKASAALKNLDLSQNS